MKLLAIYGPTVSGKTDLALQLARKFQCELISADSRQVYRGLDIGAGKISFDSMFEKHKGFWVVDGVRVNGFDLVNPQENFSAADFIKFANSSIVQTIELGKLPIVVGGTGFYIKGLIEGIDTLGIPQDERLRKELEKLSALNLYQKFLKLEPNRAKKMNQSDRWNPRRLIRALEIYFYNRSHHIKKSKSQRTVNGQLSIVNCLIIGLNAPNAFLYKRADDWLETRLERGLIDEVYKLTKQVKPEWLEDLGLEYRWLTRYVLGKIDYNLALGRLRGDIHNFIRRQKTFFNQFKETNIFDISQKNWQIQLEKLVNTWYNQ